MKLLHTICLVLHYISTFHECWLDLCATASSTRLRVVFTDQRVIIEKALFWCPATYPDSSNFFRYTVSPQSLEGYCASSTTILNSNFHFRWVIFSAVNRNSTVDISDCCHSLTHAQKISHSIVTVLHKKFLVQWRNFRDFCCHNISNFCFRWVPLDQGH